MNIHETKNAAVVGTTGWGTTLAILLARKGIAVNLLARTKEEAEKLIKDGENIRFAPDIAFPDTLKGTSSLNMTSLYIQRRRGATRR